MSLADLSVAAIVTTYNRKSLLVENLKAIFAQTRLPDRVIVVDNASTDGTSEILANNFPSVTKITLTGNLGLDTSITRGMQFAFEQGHQWCWVLDDDALPLDTCLEQLIRALSEIPVPLSSIGGITSVIVSPTSGQPYGVYFWKHRPIALSNEQYNQLVPLQVDLITYGSCLFNRTAIETAGYPPEQFFLRGDDREHSLRLINAGFRNFLAPQSRVMHEISRAMVVSEFGRKRLRTVDSPMKIYYDSRNNFFAQMLWDKSPIAYAFSAWRELRRFVGVITYDDQKILRIKMQLWGICDALRGRLGRRNLT